MYIRYIILISLLISFGISEASFGIDKIDNQLVGSDLPLEITVQSYIAFVLNFLYVLAVIVGIFGGFTIMTAAGDEDKVKKGRDYILYMALGILLIFLAGSIVELIIESILDPQLQPVNL